MKTKNTKPKPRTKPPLFVFKFKIDQFTWIAACRRCSFAKGYYSHPLALKAALSHHSKCLNTQSAPDLYGWIELQSLWSEGEVPLIRKTADQLKVGTYFLGKEEGDSPCLAYVGRPLEIDAVKTIYYAPEMLKTITPASEWVVLEEYGTFQKPEGK